MKKSVVLAMAAMMTAAVVTGCGAAGGGKDIGKDEALEIALSDAGVHENDTTRLRVSEDRDDGGKVYEIQFDAAGVEYDYEVAAEDGKILSAENEQVPVEAVPYNTDNTAQQDQTDDTQGNAGVQENQTDDTKTNDNAQQNQTSNDQTNNTNNTNNANVKVSQEEAIAIALKRVPGATEKDIHIEFDTDDGQYRYEGDIIYDQKEYDFEIDANSGTILEWSEERR